MMTMSRPSCVIENCVWTAFKAEESKGKFVYHSIPSDREQFEKWQTILREKTRQPLSPNSRVCSFHFDENDYEIWEGKRLLKDSAIPHRNLDLNATHQKKIQDLKESTEAHIRRIQVERRQNRRSDSLVFSKCCVDNCQLIRDARAIRAGYKFHSMPDQPKRFASWSRALETRVPFGQLESWFIICSRHFTEDSYDDGGRRLVQSSLPTIFDDRPGLAPDTVQQPIDSVTTLLRPNDLPDVSIDKADGTCAVILANRERNADGLKSHKVYTVEKSETTPPLDRLLPASGYGLRSKRSKHRCGNSSNFVKPAPLKSVLETSAWSIIRRLEFTRGRCEATAGRPHDDQNGPTQFGASTAMTSHELTSHNLPPMTSCDSSECQKAAELLNKQQVTINTLQDNVRELRRQNKAMKRRLLQITSKAKRDGDELKDAKLAKIRLENQLCRYEDLPSHFLVKEGRTFNSEQRRFALTLYCHGPRAYAFLAKRGFHLPHRKQIDRWMKEEQIERNEDRMGAVTTVENTRVYVEALNQGDGNTAGTTDSKSATDVIYLQMPEGVVLTSDIHGLGATNVVYLIPQDTEVTDDSSRPHEDAVGGIFTPVMNDISVREEECSTSVVLSDVSTGHSLVETTRKSPGLQQVVGNLQQRLGGCVGENRSKMVVAGNTSESVEREDCVAGRREPRDVSNEAVTAMSILNSLSRKSQC